jgi:mannan endo-1,4-beta-mannosidase
VNRSVLAAVVAPVAAAVGFLGTFWLTGQHTGRPDSAALAGIDRVAGQLASASSHPASSKPDKKRSTRKAPPARKGSAGRKASPPSGSPPPLAPSGGAVLTDHLFVGVAPTNATASAIRSFSAVTGAHMALVEFYTPFGNPFPEHPAAQVVALGSTPFIQWNPNTAPLRSIAAGNYDGYLRQYAAAAKAFGHDIVLSFGHEMNGAWSLWGSAHATPVQFVAAWQRIHNIFANQNVTNVTWSWDPSHVGADPRPWWPGAAYVDRIGIDGYERPGNTFAQIFAARLALIRSFASKPIFIAETSVAPSPGAPSQIIGLFNGVIQYHLTGFVWFDINHLEQWRLEGRPAAISAFRSCVVRNA